MAGLDDLINHPNFGKLYAASYGFRTATNSLISKLPGLENIFPTLQVSTNQEKELTFSLLNKAHPVKRAVGQSNIDYLTTAISEAYGPITRQRTADTRTGAAGNRRLQFIEEQFGVKFNIESYNMEGKHAAEDIAERMKGKGVAIANSETSTLIHMEEKGHFASMNRIFELIGINPETTGAPFKRMNAIFNEAEAELVYDARKRRVSVAVYDPVSYFGRDEQLRSTLLKMGEDVERKSTAAALKNPANQKYVQTADEFIRDALKSLGDGSLVMSKSSLNRTIAQMNDAKKVLVDDLANSNLPRNSREYLAKAKEIKKIEDKIETVQTNSKKGLSFMSRIFNADEYASSEKIGFMKGEVTVVDDDEFIRLNRVMNPNLRPKEILDNIDYMSLDVNVKNELGTFKKIAGKLQPRLSFATLNANPMPETAVSNTLTSATFSGFLDTKNYLNRGLLKAIDTDLDTIRKGQIPPGLNKIIDDVIAMSSDGLEPAEGASLRASQEFANRIKSFLANGGDLTKDPFLTKQLISQVKEHYFRVAKQGGEYTIDGVTHTAFSGRFPMMGSTLAHLESTEFTRRKTPMGVLRIDHTRGRFGMSGHDIIAAKEALGGFDFDDSIQSIYAYDKETKRLLVKVFRDPNQMGEFYLFDADITHDANLPQAIRQEYVRHNKILEELKDMYKSGKAKDTEVRAKLTELNQHKKTLNDYFSGKEVELKNKLGVKKVYAQDFIDDMNIEQLYKNGMPPPSSSKFNIAGYKRESHVLSFKEVQIKKVSKIMRSIVNEKEDMMTGKSTSGVFEYMYKGYSEYNDFFTMVGPKPDIDPLTKLPRIVKKMPFDREFVDQALRNAQKNNTVLGRAINQFTVIDEFVGSHLDFYGENAVDPRMKKKLEEILKRQSLKRVEREEMIDALMKGEMGKEKFVEEIKGMLGGNMEELGRTIRELDDYAEANNIAYKAGIDPVTFAARMARDKEQAAALERGYGGKGFLLPDTDLKARETARQLQQRTAYGYVDEEAEAIIAQTNKKLSETLGKDFTPAQMERARLLVNDIEAARIAAREIDPEKLIEMGLEGKNIDDLALRMGKENLHIRTIAQMDKMGQSDILAVARVLLDSGGDMSILNQAAPLRGSSLTVHGIYQRALNQEGTLGRMAQITDDFQFDEFIEYDAGAKTYKYTEAAGQLIDTQARKTHMLSAWEKAEQNRFTYASGKMWAPDTPMPLMPADQFYGMKEFIETQHGQEGVSVAKRWGQMANRMRSVSDDAAEDVLAASGNNAFTSTIRRLGMEDLRVSKNIRVGLMAAGAFALFGIGHRILKGDRSVEAANPYPLIPQDSRYESILENEGVSTSQSMGVGGSMRYVIKAHNIPDVQALSSGLQGVLPNGSATIYNSNAYQTSNANSNSRDILRERLGQS